METHRLSVLAHGAGSVEWRVEVPAVTRQSVLRDVLLALLVVALPAACLGTGWRTALTLAVLAAVAFATLRAILGVQSESLTYIRLLGVRLATRRRSGLWCTSHFLPLRQLQGIIIHEEVTATSVHFFLGLTLRDGAADGRVHGSGSGGSDGRQLQVDGGRAEVVFPRLRPRLNVLRQVYQQLQPLLSADIDALAVPANGKDASLGAAAAAATAAAAAER